MTQTLLLATILIPWAGALAVLLAGDIRPRLQNILASLFAVLAGVAALALLPTISSQTVRVFSIGGVFGDFTLLPDGLGVFLAAVATVIGSLAVIFSMDYMKGEAQTGRYYGLVLFFIGAMAGLVLTSNLLFVFVFWEITALCSYALISFNNDDPKAVAGGIKALIITQVGGIGLLAGALVVYANLGTTDLTIFLEKAHLLPPALLGLTAFGFLAAAAAKSAQFPFQTWLPDAMEAPTPVSALIHAATMVNAGVYLLVRFYPAFEGVPHWRTSVVVVGLLSALLAALMALAATDLKRVLAYSTVSQLGYMVYGVGAGGIFASQFHLLSHAVFKALLFLAAGAVIHSVGTRDLRKMGGLGKQLPLVRAVFIIGSLALAGIPILNGFWSKEMILEAGLLHTPGWAYAGMVLVAGLTALYTFRCVWLVFYGENRGGLHAHPAGSAMRFSLVLLAFGSLTTWLLAGVFGRALSASLPFHTIPIHSTLEMMEEVVTAPATYLALAVITAGLAMWWLRPALQPAARAFQWLMRWAQDSFGFEAANRSIVAGVQGAAEALRSTQTGQLNWNILAIVACLLGILAILAMGA